MKRILSLLFAFLLTVGVTGCGLKTAGSGYGETLTGRVEVYYFRDGFFEKPDCADALAAFRAAKPEVEIEATVFTESGKLAEALAAALAAGTPPDLVLCDLYGSGADVRQLFTEDELLDLAPYLAADATYEPENFYTAALDACASDGVVFALPLGVSPFLIVTSEERLKAAGLDWESAVTAGEKLALLTGYLDAALKKDPESCPYMSFPGGAGFSNGSLHPFGLSLADHAARAAANVDEEELRACVDWYLAANRTSEVGWNGGFVQKARGLPMKWSAMCGNVTLACPAILPGASDYRLLDAAYTLKDETMTVLAVPLFDDPLCYGATVSSCGVVPARAANPDGGYALLRFLMDWEAGTGCGFPARRSGTEAALAESGRPYAAQIADVLDNLTEARLYESWRLDNDLYTCVCDSAYAATGEDFRALADAMAKRVGHWLTTEEQ